MLNCLDLFSGIGGFARGFEQIGWSTVGFCEIDPSCQKILQRHWPDVPIFPDIGQLNAHTLEQCPVDVLCGGFPCQDISVAGKQAGITGSRSGLWKEFHRLINEVKPRYAIIENVANLRGNGLVTVLQDLWQIGYDAEWHCIPASALGAPHQRDRIWIIAYPHSQRCQCKESTATGKDDPQGRQKCTQDTITGGNSTAAGRFPILQAGSGKDAGWQGLYSSENLLAHTNGTRTMVERRTDQTIAPESDIGRGIIRRCRKDGKLQFDSKTHETLAYPLFAGLEGYSSFPGDSGTGRQIIQQSQISLCRSTRGTEAWGEEPFIPRLKDKGLNPDWVEWLMGFPIGWTENVTRKERLRSLGNAVVPLIPEMIAASINEFEAFHLAM